MKEDWLHYIWKLKRLPLNLKTVNGETLVILHPGKHNKDSGPDFFEATIRINQLVWSGNIEIHIRSSDWLRHKHQEDKAYENVILHVVYIHDKEVFINNEKIPVLELRNLISKEELEKISSFSHSQTTIPCATQWQLVPTIIKQKEIESAFFRRLERKCLGIETRFLELNKDPFRLKLELLGKIIATKVNEIPMIELINRIPFSILFRLSTEQRIAFLLGVSGLIPKEIDDDYVKKLSNDALFLMVKYKITSMNKASWKFFGCRPPAYPTLRIVMFAILLDDKILFNDFENVEVILNWVDQKSIDFPIFWKFHTHFNNLTNKRENNFSKELKVLIIINYYIPFYYWRFSKMNEIELLERLISLTELLPPEKNTKVLKFQKLGQKIKSIGETQGLLELLNDFCVNKQCLHCQIGVKLLN